MAATTLPTVAERVAAGAAWLDEHESGWLDRIDADGLSMGDAQNCVLGQLGGHFDDYRFAHGISSLEAAHDLGFTEFGGGYDVLGLAWQALINARRAEEVSA